MIEMTGKNSDINVNGIKVAYTNKTVIEDLSINIPEGKITTIIGPNGCGKSTLLKAIGRIIGVEKGSIYLDCKDIHKLSTKELAKRLSILPQSPTAPEGMTVEELVSYGRFPYQRGLGRLAKEDEGIINWAIAATNLTGLNARNVESLSGGQRQRVWIAMALAQQTSTILLDEPTTYLDMAYQLEVLELLEQLNKYHGCTIIMVLHDINLAAKFADYLIALKDGKIVSAGCPKEVMTKEVLRNVYNIDANIVVDESSGHPICISYQLVGRKGNRKQNVQRGA